MFWQLRRQLPLGFGLSLMMVSAASAHQVDAPGRMEMTPDGPVLVTPTGMSLYSFGRDSSTPGKSSCTNEPSLSIPDPTGGFGRYMLPGYQYIKSCIEVWPPYLAPEFAKAAGDWSFITRPEGQQWSYQGKPLYLSVKDTGAGERNGVLAGGGGGGRGGWSLARGPAQLPAGIALGRAGQDLVLTDTDGRPLYTPSGKRGAKQDCAICADSFTPVSAPAVATVMDEWSIIDAADGVRQYAYRHKPLFRAPEGTNDFVARQGGNWELVVVKAGAPLPSAIRVKRTMLGETYATRDNMTLYMFTCSQMGCDAPGGAAALWAALCQSGPECSRRWRPYLADAGAKPSGEWSIVEVADPIFSDAAGQTYPADAPRFRAWAFKGRPVYTYFEDRSPNDVMGHQIRFVGFASFNALGPPSLDNQD